MKILVTGGSGRVGQCVCSVLREPVREGERNWVMNLDRTAPSHGSRGWFIPVDINQTDQLYDMVALHRPDAIVHLAANPMSFGPPRHQQFTESVSATFGIVQVAADLGIPKVIIASSEMAAGWSTRKQCPKRLPYTEDDVIATPNAYALSKLVGEQIAESLVINRPELSVVSLRLNYVHVPDPSSFDANSARFGNVFSPNLWGYVRGEDVGDAVWAAIERAPTGHRVYAIAAKDSMSRIPIRELVATHFGSEIDIAEDLPEFGSAVDTSRVERELGWVARRHWNVENDPVNDL